MPLEREQLVVPVRLELVEPCPQRDHRLWSKPEDPNAGVFRWTFVGDDAGSEEDSQVLAHRRSSKALRCGQLASTARSVTQELHDTDPGRVRERLEQRRQSSVLINSHVANSYRMRKLVSRAW